MRRGFAFILVTSLTASACTQVLDIEDRTLRSGSESDSGSAFFSADSGSETDSAGLGGTEAGVLTTSQDPARAVFSSNAIDFGMIACGDTSPASRTLTVNNAGDYELDWQATLSPTSSFSLIGETAGPVAGQSFATITIASSGFPTFATAGQTEQATLTVTVTLPDHAPTSQDFTITETAAGASLSLDPGIAAFGEVQVGVPASPMPIDLRNTGNLPTTLTLGTSTDPQFSLASDAGTMILGPGETVSGLIAQFLPTSATQSTSMVSISAGGGPMCGVAPSALHLTGLGTTGPIALQPGSLDFGLVSCGTTAPSKQVTLSTSAGTASWTASLGKGGSSPFVISPASGIVVAGSPALITVSPNAIPTTSAITPDLYADSLTIVAPDGSHVIPLHETAQGAILSQSTTTVSFGGVNIGTSATSAYNVVNNGNASASVTFSSTNPAFGIAPQSQTLGGQGYSSSVTATFSPTAQNTYTGSSSITVSPDTVLCGPAPASIALSGTGTVNYASVSPSSLDFGLVACGHKGSSSNVTITNSAPVTGPSFNWTATLGKGAASPYTLSSTSGNIKGQKTVTLTVTPSTIPQVSSVASDYYADALSISTDAANDGVAHIVNLHETAQGVILALGPSSLPLGSVASGSSATAPFQITNAGNLPAQVMLYVSGSYFTVDPSIGTVNGGSSVQGTSTFAPSRPGLGARTATVTAMFAQTNCGGTVAPLSLSGTGL